MLSSGIDGNQITSPPISTLVHAESVVKKNTCLNAANARSRDNVAAISVKSVDCVYAEWWH